MTRATTLAITALCAALTLSLPWGGSAYAVTSAQHLKLRNYAFTFEEYIAEYGKKYEDPEEYEMRRRLFQQRLEEVREHNEDPARSRLWYKGINAHSDRTADELRTQRGYDRSLGFYQRERDELGSRHGPVPTPDPARLAALPERLDWREHQGVLTAVKDQGNCGSCWAFAATATLESRWFLATGNLMDLSVQDIVSCAPNPHKCGGSGGCNGGTAELAFEYAISSGGLPSEWTHSYFQYYNNNTATCPDAKQGPIRATFDSYKKVKSNDLSSVMEALQSGPVAATVDASSWHGYEGGIFDGCDPKKVTLNHGVQLVGYGSETLADGVKHLYWIIRNSWSTEMGENGFYRLKREDGQPQCAMDYNPQEGVACEGETDPVTVCGMCGVLYDVSYPELNRKRGPREL